MNAALRFLVIALLIVYGLPAPAAGPILSGVVTDAKTHTPVGRAEVTAVGGRASSDVTDSKGKFVLRLAATVTPGETVELRVRKIGYIVYDEKVSAGELALTIELQPANSRGGSSTTRGVHSSKEDLQRELLRHSFTIKDFTVDWTIHLPDRFTMSGQPKDGYAVLSALFCSPLRDSVFDITLVPPDAAPFGNPILIMEAATQHIENGPGCKFKTSLVTPDENGSMVKTGGFGYELELVNYDERRHLLSLRSLVRRYTLIELKTPSLVVSDFGAATSKLPWVDNNLSYGALAYWGKDVGSITLDQVPKSVDIVVRPYPPEGEVDSHWTITTTALPPMLTLSTGRLDIPYERRD